MCRAASKALSFTNEQLNTLGAVLVTEAALELLMERRQGGVTGPAAAVNGAPGVPNMGGGPADLVPNGGAARIVQVAQDVVRLAKTALLDVQECEGSKVPDVRAGCRAIAEAVAMIPVYAGGTKLRIDA